MLQQTIIEYLESKGWYYDWDHVIKVWWEPKDDAERGEFIRRFHGWTLPQWAEYWTEPYADEPTHKNFGKPKTRRHEDLKDALWSQICREELPEKFHYFFDDPKPEATNGN